MSATLIKHSFCPLSRCLTPLCIYIRYSFMAVSEGNREGGWALTHTECIRAPLSTLLQILILPIVLPHAHTQTCTHKQLNAFALCLFKAFIHHRSASLCVSHLFERQDVDLCCCFFSVWTYAMKLFIIFNVAYYAQTAPRSIGIPPPVWC